MKKQAGMTLIELVIVIIVLGIIAAVAAPKFADVSTAAKDAAGDGSVGAFKSAVTISKAQNRTSTPSWDEVAANLDGFDVSAAGVATANFDGGAVDLTIQGYKSGSCAAANVLAAADTATRGTFTNWSADGGTTCNTL